MGSAIDCLQPEQLAALVPAIAIAISEGLSPDEATSLGSFITAVGDTIVLIGAQRALLNGLQPSAASQGR